MISKTHPSFWNYFLSLPTQVQTTAREKYQLWLNDPFHPSLQFKEIYPGLWSVRINLHYRALARRHDDDLIVWFWIGPHSEYDRLIAR